MMMIMWL